MDVEAGHPTSVREMSECLIDKICIVQVARSGLPIGVDKDFPEDKSRIRIYTEDMVEILTGPQMSLGERWPQSMR